MDFIASSTVNAAAAALGAQVSTNIDSVWPLLLIAVGIPLAFYITHKIMGLFPGRGGRRS